MPTISTVSPVLTCPRSTRPVTTVPRPLMPKTSSIGIRKGWSMARSGVRDVVVDRLHQLPDAAYSGALGILASRYCSAARALPRTMGISSPGKP